MKTIIKSLIFILFLAFTACENMVTDVEAPPIDPKIVVTGFISPDNEFNRIRVHMSRPVYSTYTTNYNPDNQEPEYEDATVVLSDGVNSTTLLYRPDIGYSVSQEDFPIVKGTTYYLKVTAPGGFVAESSCTVPVDTPPDIEITDIDATIENNYRSFDISGRFKDIEGEGHFYSVSVASVRNDSWFGTTPYIAGIGFQHGERYISDVNKDNQIFSFKTYQESSPEGDTEKVYLFIAITDIHYYDYHKGLDNYEGDNPFAEPTPVYSNIIGGVGVFAAYNQKTTEIEL